ncbi:MAG: TonB-dependent receptor [Phaeodactylibacter sp.]|nr:TonB-dependent receptor [Phaeodactylibacter sp.]MCB9054083.1 TonB-dependent receptor [Lewinellaceae bacterium]
MKKQLPILLFLFSAFAAFAQQPPYGNRQQQGPSIKGKVTGHVIDSVAGAPVEFATLVLKAAGSGKESAGGITDEKGHFKLQDVRNGKYELHISFIGYATKVVPEVELTLEKPDVDLGDIYMASENITLNAVEVTEERALIENRIDKIVFNADQDVTTVGGDAVDVLRKAPLLSVDFDGNVSLRGSQNVQILINGRPSTLFAQNPGEALRSIPADQIKSVEVITTPSAKYDGEGTAGIINIITKKKSVEGFTGSVNSSVGTRINRGGLNLSLASGRFGLNASGSTWLSWPRDGYSEFYREDTRNDTLRILTQDANTRGNSYGPRGSVGAFYDINAYNSLSSSLTFGGFGGNNEGTTDATYEIPLSNLQQIYTRTNDSRSLRGSFDWTTDYRRTFKKEEQELVMAFQWSGAQGNQRNTILQVGNDPRLELDEKNRNDSYNFEYTLQADYVHPLTDAVKLETGAKGVIRRIDSDYQYEAFDQEKQAYLLNTALSDEFFYDQDVYSAYLSFNIKMGENYGLVAGARYEFTDIGGEYASDAASFTNDYGNFLPSIILSRKLKNFSTLKVSYARRIQRPSLFFVNPYTDLNDPRNITVGNPVLSPELTDQYELSYGAFVKGFSINASLFYRFTDDVIQSFLFDVDEAGASRSTFLNIGKNHSYGVNFFTSVTIAKIWTLRGGANIFTFNTERNQNGEQLSNDALLFNGNINSTIDFGKGYKFEMFGFYRAPRQTIQGKNASFSLLSIGFLKEFNKRASLGINITEPFFNYKEFPSELEGEDFYQRSNNAILFRSFGLTFNYRFGKLDFRQQRRRTRIENDDLKEGGGDQF